MPRTAKPTGPKVFDWETTKVRSFHEWEVSMPERGTPRWNELVALLMKRTDIDHDWWPTEMIVNALILDAEKAGEVHHEFGYRFYDHETNEVKFRTLGRALRVEQSDPAIYDPAHWKIALESTELEVEHNPVLAVAAGLGQTIHLPDEVSREDAIRYFIGELTEYVNATYGS